MKKICKCTEGENIKEYFKNIFLRGNDILIVKEKSYSYRSQQGFPTSFRKARI